MIKNLILPFLVICAIHSICAQKAIPNFKSAKSFHDYEKLFMDIAKDSDQYQGYKWMARWIEVTSSRIDADGNLPDLSILDKETRKFNYAKNNSTDKFNNTWMPVGPNHAPEPFDEIYIKGTGRINTITFHPTDPNIMWIGGGQGGVWKSIDHGQSWMPIGDDLPVLRISHIAVNPQNPDEMYVALGDFAYITVALDLDDRNRNTHYGMGIYKTLDGGVTWVPTNFTRKQEDRDYSLTRKILIHPENTNRLLAVGIHGAWLSEDAGDSWEQLDEREFWDLEQSPSDPNVLYASTGYLANLDVGEASILKSTDFGLTWEELQTNIPKTGEVERLKISISFSNTNYVYAVACDLAGGYYGLYASTDAGATWELRSTTPNILHWGDGVGQGGQGSYDLAITVDPHNPEKVIVGGVNPWVSEDGGRTWGGAGYYVGFFGPSIHADHHYYVYNPMDEYIYACHDGGVSRTQEVLQGSWDEGGNDPDYAWPTQWEHLNNGLANFAFYRLGVYADNAENVLAGAQDMGVFYQNNDVWNYLLLGDGMECIVHPEDPNIIYSSTQFGRLGRSENGGQSSFSIRPWGSEFAAWTTPFKMDESNPDIIYVPIQNVWVSENGGASFQKTGDISNEFPICAFAVSASDPNYMYAAKRIYHSEDQPTEIFRTEDGGATWLNITVEIPTNLFIKYLDVDDNDPLHVWITYGGFDEGSKVYETFNGGDTWENISLNLPNLPANCIVHQNGSDTDALYVGMDRGVYYKDNTMSAWELYSDGLPNVIVTELEIHEASQQLMITTFGRGVWRNNLIPANSTSTEDLLTYQLEVDISPSPNNGQFTMNVNSPKTKEVPLRIVNVMGQTVHEEMVKLNPEQKRFPINLDLQAGLYYASITIGNRSRTVSFVVDK